jgi:hypothetical protein
MKISQYPTWKKEAKRGKAEKLTVGLEKEDHSVCKVGEC